MVNRFQNILYLTDSSLEDGSAIEHAAAFARQNDASLTIVEVFEPIPDFVIRQTPYKIREIRMEERSAVLHKLAKTSLAGITADIKLLEGKPFLEVIRDVLREKRDLVIKPAGGRFGGLSGLFGSTDMHLLRKCPCPVWLIKPTHNRPMKRIMAAVDFEVGEDENDPNNLNLGILDLAVSLFPGKDGNLDIVHVWDAPFEAFLRNSRSGLSAEEVESYVEGVWSASQDHLKALIRTLRHRIGEAIYGDVEPKVHLVRGPVSETIVAQTKQLKIDLLVMGTVARAGIPGLLIGNTAEAILAQVDCSVFAVKPAGFVSPVTLGPDED